MPTGVFVIVLSRTVIEPVVIALEPPAVMSIPTWQLLIERPEYVQPQSHS
jgi:hypothetical protein